MNVLITSKSYSLMNTGKVAQAMAGATNATLRKVGEARPEELAGYQSLSGESYELNKIE